MSLAALLDAGGEFTVRADGREMRRTELVRQSDRLRNALWQLGVRPGDRVGLRMHKSPEAVVAIFGILKAGAVYVPVDAESPPARGAYILNDCEVRALIVEQKLRAPMEKELETLECRPSFLSMDDIPPAPAVPTVYGRPGDIAYILYTSGSTGKPKGVVLSHANAASFLDWCSAVFQPTSRDVFSSHAPFHFDLSILDIYLPAKHGATLVLIGEELGKDPLRLAATIADQRISCWYSTPSILNLLRNYGKLERYDYSALRTVSFAGEVFPVPQFRALKTCWPNPRYFNLYGPTETNVCTWYEVPTDDSALDRDTFPIGQMCEPNEGRVVDEAGSEVAPGSEGELVVAGPNVMRGYWNLPEQNASAFLVDDAGRSWYRTGDLVVEDARGQYLYRGRRDRMVKRRGYRVELGEIECALLRHPDIREAAVVAVADQESGVKIGAFVSCEAGRQLNIISLKRYSVQSLPPYMIPDSFLVLERLPRTSTDKTDLQALKSRL